MSQTPDNTPTVLITGFGPFPGVSINATSTLAPSVASAARKVFPDIDFNYAVLPTDWTGARSLLDELKSQLSPEVSLHFGVSDSAQGFVIETTAKNICKSMEDAAGRLPKYETLYNDDSDQRLSTFPSDTIISELRKSGLPAEHSQDAGGYLCNAVLYQSLRFDEDHTNHGCTGFIHVPVTLGCRDTKPPFTMPMAIDGSMTILRACLDRVTMRNENLTH